MLTPMVPMSLLLCGRKLSPVHFPMASSDDGIMEIREWLTTRCTREHDKGHIPAGWHDCASDSPLWMVYRHHDDPISNPHRTKIQSRRISAEHIRKSRNNRCHRRGHLTSTFLARKWRSPFRERGSLGLYGRVHGATFPYICGQFHSCRHEVPSEVPC